MTRGFHQTFGNYLKVMDDEFSKGRLVQGINGAWQEHNYGDKDVKGIKNLGEKLSSFFNRYSGITIYWSPFTEHNLNNFDKYGDIAQAACPRCIIVNSVYRGSLSTKYQNEVHGSHIKPTGKFLLPGVSYSSDGSNSPDQNFSKIFKDYQDAKFVCGWTWSFNLFYGSSDTANRDTRIKEANIRKPDKDLIQSILYLFTRPSGMSLAPEIYLIKSHADNHGPTDTKGNKLLIISTINSDYVELKDSSGHTAAKLTKYGAFDGCRNCIRYYWDRMGYLAGKFLSLIIKGKKYGDVDPGFRCCHFIK